MLYFSQNKIAVLFALHLIISNGLKKKNRVGNIDITDGFINSKYN